MGPQTRSSTLLSYQPDKCNAHLQLQCLASAFHGPCQCLFSGWAGRILWKSGPVRAVVRTTRRSNRHHHAHHHMMKAVVTGLMSMSCGRRRRRSAETCTGKPSYFHNLPRGPDAVIVLLSSFGEYTWQVVR